MGAMNEQLYEIIDDFKRAQERMHALSRVVPDDEWGIRAEPGRWSVSENVEHLNMFSEVYIPMLTTHLEEARGLTREPGFTPLNDRTRYRRGFVGWVLWRMMPPPVRYSKVPAIAAFVPNAIAPAPQVRARFDRLQLQLVGLAASADGLPLDKVTMTSPVNPRIRYNLFAALGIIPRHQHRHLWQAENTLKS
jgi:hypothetical protein